MTGVQTCALPIFIPAPPDTTNAPVVVLELAVPDAATILPELVNPVRVPTDVRLEFTTPDPNVVAFSTYVWNKNYNYALAKRLKEINPTCIIIFGGPELPITNKEIFVKYPFIDIVIKGEGEITFRKVLEGIVDSSDLLDIPGLLLNRTELIID